MCVCQFLPVVSRSALNELPAVGQTRSIRQEAEFVFNLLEGGGKFPSGSRELWDLHFYKVYLYILLIYIKYTSDSDICVLTYSPSGKISSIVQDSDASS